MPLSADIILKIKRDFGNDADEIVTRLENLSTNESEIFSQPRIIRCLIFAAAGKVKDLDEAISLARIDVRDLILGAEYDYNKGDKSFTLARDMQKPFSD